LIKNHKNGEDDIIIQAVNLWRTYKRGTEQEINALRGINLLIHSNSFIALKGRSGSGKTTLLNILGGLDYPTEGTVFVFGSDISKLSDKELTRWRRTRVGFVFQSFGLSPSLSAFENIELMLRISGASHQQRRERTDYCLDLVGLTKRRDHRPDEMSGGQQQRLAIARALANNPRLILADEPTGELDSSTAREVLSLFTRIVREEHVTMLLASHDPLVDNFVDKIFQLKDGLIL